MTTLQKDEEKSWWKQFLDIWEQIMEYSLEREWVLNSYKG